MLVILLPLAILFIYFYYTRNHDYWTKRNVKHDRPVPLFGNIFQNIIGKKSITEIVTELYRKYPNEKVVGLYYGTTPSLIIRDLDLVRKIFNVDFAHFYQRGHGRDPKIEPLFLNLLHANGDSWKLLRQRQTLIFTTAKIKKMFPLIVECAEKLQIICENAANSDEECNVRELMARFTTDFIGSCGFGLQMDCMSNENSLYRKYGKLIVDQKRSWNSLVLARLYELFPEFNKLLQFLLRDLTYLNLATKMVESICDQRNYKPSGRSDFVDLILELHEKGKIITESIEKKNPDGSPVLVEMEMDKMCMVAQINFFFAAGFETSSAATSYLLHELAFYPEEQIKIQENIDQVLSKYNNKLCYDAIAEMTSLNMAFKEAMRKFSASGALKRICTKRYPIPELGITLDPGVKIFIPVQGIHYNDEYYDDPFEFKPDRFAETTHTRNKYTYLPFGAGPRMCLGERLGEMESLAGIAAVLQKFTVEPGPSTKRVPEIDHTNNVVQTVMGGLPLKLKHRNLNHR